MRYFLHSYPPGWGKLYIVEENNKYTGRILDKHIIELEYNQRDVDWLFHNPECIKEISEVKYEKALQTAS